MMKFKALKKVVTLCLIGGVICSTPLLVKADTKDFKVGFDSEYPPFGYMNDKGEYVGFDLDLAELVCKDLGWKLEKKPINWDSKDLELNSGNIDCIWNGFTRNGREDDYTFSPTYLLNKQVFVVKKGSKIEKLSDLKGKNVVVQAASAALDAINKDENKKLKESFGSLNENPDYNTAFMNLESGACDAVAVDIGVAKFQIDKRGKDKYEIVKEPLQNEEYAIGFKKGNKELEEKVWKEVLKLNKEGKVKELAKKYKIEDMLSIKEDKK